MSSQGGKAAAATVAGFALASAFALLSRGFYQNDDPAHYVLARNGWGGSAASLLDWWGRPGLTVPLALAEGIGGLPAGRLLSAGMTALSAWLAYLMAERLTRGKPDLRGLLWLAPALLWLQPLVATLAQTTLTETPALLCLTLAGWLWVCGRPLAACAVLSLSFVTRYELSSLALVPAVALVMRRDRRWGRLAGGAAALAWAPLAYAAAALLLGVPRSSSPLALLVGSSVFDYGRGGWFHFLPRWALAAGAGTLVLAAAGAGRLRARGAVSVAFALGVFGVETLLYRFGLFASGGYARFLVPSGGIVAALAAAGAGWIGARSRPLLVSLLALTALQAIVLVRPLTLTLDMPEGPDLPPGPRPEALVWSAALLRRPLAPRAFAEQSALALALEALPRGPARLFTGHSFVRCYRPDAEMVWDAGEGSRRWSESPAGAVFVWDSSIGPSEAGIDAGGLREELAAGGELLSSRRAGEFRAEVFRKRSPPAPGPHSWPR